MSRKSRQQGRWHGGAWEDSTSHTELLPTEKKTLQISLGQTPLCWPIQVPVHREEAHLPLFLVHISYQSKKHTPSPNTFGPCPAMAFDSLSLSLSFPVWFSDTVLANLVLGSDPIL